MELLISVSLLIGCLVFDIFLQVEEFIFKKHLFSIKYNFRFDEVAKLDQWTHTSFRSPYVLLQFSDPIDEKLKPHRYSILIWGQLDMLSQT